MLRPVAAALAFAALLTLTACAAHEPPPAEPTPSETAPPPPPPSPEELRHRRAVEIVDAMSTREQVASVVMGTAPGTDAASLRAYVAENGLGGFIIMGGNVPGTPEELRAIADGLVVDPELPPIIAIDQEGGEVSRLPWDGNPGADQLKFAPPADTAAAFGARAALLAEAGINTNFGIVADVPRSESSFIYGRALGADPAEAASRVAAAVDGEHGTVASTLKHFPGHGAAEGDSHFGVRGTDLGLEDWRQGDALPFAAGIDAGAELLMFGHLAYASVDPLPASLSPEWYRIARQDLGFTGVAVTDDLGMLLASGVPEFQDLPALVARALAAGADLALIVQEAEPEGMPALLDAVAAAADAGGIPAERLHDAAVRVAELRLALGARAAG